MHFNYFKKNFSVISSQKTGRSRNEKSLLSTHGNQMFYNLTVRFYNQNLTHQDFAKIMTPCSS